MLYRKLNYFFNPNHACLGYNFSIFTDSQNLRYKSNRVLLIPLVWVINAQTPSHRTVSNLCSSKESSLPGLFLIIPKRSSLGISWAKKVKGFIMFGSKTKKYPPGFKARLISSKVLLKSVGKDICQPAFFAVIRRNANHIH